MSHDAREIANEIRRYFDDRPDAADTLDGIADWWLARSRMDVPVELIQEALNNLVARGEVEKRVSGGREIYRAARRPRP